MKKGILLLLVGFCLGIIALWLASYYNVKIVEETIRDNVHLETTVVDVFKFTLEEEVRKKTGEPEAGFKPEDYLAVFPGLSSSDFNGVIGNSGTYVLENGKLVFNLKETGLRPTTYGGIGRTGMKTLLNNIAERSKIDLTANGTLTDVMRVLTTE
ncbi:hypothetical protein KC845_00415 [Candidatus Kaiserbacteria bacterium]|nr:hypothetical protein [Candidatus Kaiserbacteria bacterium]